MDDIARHACIRANLSEIKDGITYVSQVGDIDSAINAVADDPTSRAIRLVGRDEVERLTELRTAMLAAEGDDKKGKRDRFREAAQHAAERAADAPIEE